MIAAGKELFRVPAQVRQFLRFSCFRFFGRDVAAGRHNLLGPDVNIGNGVVIKSLCRLDGCDVPPGAVIDSHAAQFRNGAPPHRHFAV